MRKISRDDILNGWLKYHNTSVEEVVKTHPKEILDSPEWFKLYPVTLEQSNEWEKWAKKYICKVGKYSKQYVEASWGFVYLDCAPYIKRDESLHN